MRGKLDSFSKQYTLSGKDIDRISDTINQQLEQLGMEQRNRLRIRLSFEESLLRMRDKFGEDVSVTLYMGYSLRRPFMQISMKGELFNPLSKREVDLEDWSGTLLTAVGLYPQYSYVRGDNILRLILPTKKRNPAIKLIIAIAIGILLGLGIQGLCSEAHMIALTDIVLQPLYDLWIRILSVLSGPVIFFMVITTVLNTGGIEEEGGSSNRVITRYFLLSGLVGLLAIILCIMIDGADMVLGETLGVDASEYLDKLFHIIPDDAFDPILNANTPQILLFAFVLGKGIVIIGSKAQGLSSIIRQMNMVGLLMTDWVSRCVPYIAAGLICFEILWHQTNLLTRLWIVLLLSLAVALFCIAAAVIIVSYRMEVKLSVLIRKILPDFLTAVKSGGLDEGYGETEATCIYDLGIERHYTQISMTQGIVLYMPINVIGTLILTIFAAVQFDVEISVGWLLIAWMLSVVMFVATPPVPGANLLAYIMIFGLLGVPDMVLVDAMIFEVLFGIIASAGNQTMLQMDMIVLSDKIGLLDRDQLKAYRRKSKK